MTQACCINNHRMWNGDGRVCITAHRVGYVDEFSKKHPDKVINFDAEGDKHFAVWHIYGQGNPKEEYDIWRCTKCKALSVWDYKGNIYAVYKVAELSQSDRKNYKEWEKYYIFDYETYDDFLDRVDNRNLTVKEAMDVFEKETDKMMYAYVSSNHEKIVATDNKGEIIREYLRYEI